MILIYKIYFFLFQVNPRVSVRTWNSNLPFFFSYIACEHRVNCLSHADNRMFRQRSTHALTMEDFWGHYWTFFLRSLWVLCGTNFSFERIWVSRQIEQGCVPAIRVTGSLTRWERGGFRNGWLLLGNSAVVVRLPVRAVEAHLGMTL